jgi:hypothetical protein
MVSSLGNSMSACGQKHKEKRLPVKAALGKTLAKYYASQSAGH